MAKANPIIPPSNPHFLKPIMPGSLELTVIPKAFMVNYLGENCQGKSVLKTKTGKSWKVTINKGSFTDGWKAFVTENSLCIGDILVFKHNGELKFDVIMFNSTSCEKQSPALEDKKSEKSVKKLSHFTCTMKAYNFDWRCLYIPVKFGRENSLENKLGMIKLRDPKGKFWKVILRSKKCQYVLGRGWPEFSDANKLKLADKCTFKMVSKGFKDVVMEVSILRSKCSV